MTQDNNLQKPTREIELINAINEELAKSPVDRIKLSNLMHQYHQEVLGLGQPSIIYPLLTEEEEEAAFAALAQLREQRLQERKQNSLNKRDREDNKDE